MNCCGMSIPDLKSKGLPAPLPYQRQIKVKQVDTDGRHVAWEQVEEPVQQESVSPARAAGSGSSRRGTMAELASLSMPGFMGVFKPFGEEADQRFQFDIAKLNAMQQTRRFTQLDQGKKTSALDAIDNLRKAAAGDGSYSFEQALNFSIELEQVMSPGEAGLQSNTRHTVAPLPPLVGANSMELDSAALLASANDDPEFKQQLSNYAMATEAANKELKQLQLQQQQLRQATEEQNRLLQQERARLEAESNGKTPQQALEEQQRINDQAEREWQQLQGAGVAAMNSETQAMAARVRAQHTDKMRRLALEEQALESADSQLATEKMRLEVERMQQRLEQEKMLRNQLQVVKEERDAMEAQRSALKTAEQQRRQVIQQAQQLAQMTYMKRLQTEEQLYRQAEQQKHQGLEARKQKQQAMINAVQRERIGLQRGRQELGVERERGRSALADAHKSKFSAQMMRDQLSRADLRGAGIRLPVTPQGPIGSGVGPVGTPYSLGNQSFQAETSFGGPGTGSTKFSDPNLDSAVIYTAIDPDQGKLGTKSGAGESNKGGSDDEDDNAHGFDPADLASEWSSDGAQTPQPELVQQTHSAVRVTNTVNLNQGLKDGLVSLFNQANEEGLELEEGRKFRFDIRKFGQVVKKYQPDLFKLLDTDGDGDITIEELEAHVEDVDGDGNIDIDELQTAFSKLLSQKIQAKVAEFKEAKRAASAGPAQKRSFKQGGKAIQMGVKIKDQVEMNTFAEELFGMMGFGSEEPDLDMMESLGLDAEDMAAFEQAMDEEEDVGTAINRVNSIQMMDEAINARIAIAKQANSEPMEEDAADANSLDEYDNHDYGDDVSHAVVDEENFTVHAAQDPSLDANDASGVCEAIRDYVAEGAGELSLTKGDYIVLVEKEEEPWVNDDAWLCGQVGNQTGHFPAAYVGPVNNYGQPQTFGVEGQMASLLPGEPFGSRRGPSRVARYNDGDENAALNINENAGANVDDDELSVYDPDKNDPRNGLWVGMTRPSDQLSPAELVVQRFLILKRRAKCHMRDDLVRHDQQYHGTSDWARFFTFHIVRDWRFEALTLMIILANIVTLAMNDPLQPSDSTHNATLQYFEYVFLGLYWCEAILRVLSDGFWWPKNCTIPAYIKDPYNVLDFVIIVAGTVEVILATQGFDGSVGITALRALRAVRVLRVVKGFPSIRLILKVIFMAVPDMGAIMAMSVAVYIMFVVLGMQLYSGVLERACYDIQNQTQVEIRPCGNSTSSYNCGPGQVCHSFETLPVHWPTIVPVFNGSASFNNAGIGFYTVFSVVTMEGWTRLLYAYDDALGTGANWLFFVALIMLGGYFLLSMVIGVLAGIYGKLSSDVGLVQNGLEELDDAYREPPPSTYPSIVEFTKSGVFQTVLMLTIIANCVFLGLDAYPANNEWIDMLRYANFAFVSIFVLEGCIKVLGYGFKGYFARQWNRFDFFITFLSVAEIIFAESLANDQDNVGISAFRGLRLLRIFKLFPAYDKVKGYAAGAVKSLRGLGSLLMLIFLFLVIVSLVGMQLFGGKFYSRTNFNSFGDALITSFMLQTAEGWNDVMYEGIEVSGGAKSAGALAGLFFVGVVSIGHYLLFGILLAIAYRNIDVLLPKEKVRALSMAEVTKRDYVETTDKSIPDHNAFYCFSPTNGVRVFLHKVMYTPWFDPVILICISVSSILLAAEDYQDPHAEINGILYYFDIGFTAIFVIELIVKVFAMGLIMHNRAYLRYGWNVLDFVVVVSSLLSLTLQGATDAKILKVFRVIRVLRPLRAIKRSPGLKKVVDAIMQSMVSIMGLVMVATVFMFCFAIMGVALFKGRFQYCSDSSMLTPETCVGTFYEPTSQFNATLMGLDRAWSTHYLNFDNIYKGGETLVSIFNFEEWPDIYYHSADASKIGYGPQLNNQQESILFYIVYLILVSLFFINVVMAFVTLTFQGQADILYTRTGLSKYQAQCLRYALQAKQPHDPYRHRRSSSLLRLVESNGFDLVMFSLVVLNVIALLMHYEGMSTDYADALEYANYGFVAIFALEAIFKILIYGARGYFTDAWHLTDFVIVIGSILDIILAGELTFTFLRVFRSIRLVKLFHSSGMKQLFETSVKALATVPAIFFIMLLIFYIYAVCGMVLFARLPLDPETAINEHNNFGNLGISLLTLFRVMTGENWQSVMAACYITNDSCNPNHPDGSTCGSELNVAFFMTFVLITNCLVVNILVAIIIDHFEFLYMDRSILMPYHLEKFVEEWRVLDPAGTGLIPYTWLPILMRRLEPPLGVGRLCPQQALHSFLSRLPVPINPLTKNIEFRATLVSIIRVRQDMW